MAAEPASALINIRIRPSDRRLLVREAANRGITLTALVKAEPIAQLLDMLRSAAAQSPTCTR